MPERVYADGMPLAHIIKQFGDDKSFCGRSPWPGIWRGQTAMEERVKARTMPLCATCRTILLHHNGRG